MFNYPFKLHNNDLITNSLKEYSKKFLNYNSLVAESIEEQELKNIVPGLFSQFDDLNLKFDVAKFFITPPGEKLPIHQDGSIDYPKFWALNLPIFNCNNSPMTWYKPIGGNFFQEKTWYSDAPISCYNQEDCIEIERCDITSPTWVNVRVPHSIENLINKNNRIIISIRFNITQIKDWSPLQLSVIS